MNPTFNTSSLLPNNLALLQTLLASNVPNLSTSIQPNYNQLLTQPTSSPTQASVANGRKDKPVLTKRTFESGGESGSDSPMKKTFTNTGDSVIRTPIPTNQHALRHSVPTQPIIPQTSQNQNPLTNPILMRNLTQLYQLIQLNSLLKNKNLTSGQGPNQKPIILQSTTAPQSERGQKTDFNVKMEEQSTDRRSRGDRGDEPSVQGTTRSHYSNRSRKSDLRKFRYEPYESDDSTNLSESNEPRPPITEPALVEFTKDFPDWGLADIFTFLTTGQPKKDVTPVRRSARPVVKSTSQEQEKSTLSQEEEAQLISECREEIKDLLGMDEVNESKVKLMLKKNDMKVDRVIGTVKKNLPFYKKYFTIKK